MARQVPFHPIAVVEGGRGSFAGRPDLTWRKEAHVVAGVHQSLHFRGHPQAPCVIGSVIEGNDADGIAGDDPRVRCRIEQHKGVHAGQVLDEVPSVLPVEGEDDLAIAAGLEWIVTTGSTGTPGFEVDVVVNLSVDGEHSARIRIDERLGTAEHIDNGESFMRDDGRRKFTDAGPIRSSMLLASGGIQDGLPVRIEGGRAVQQGGDGTHVEKGRNSESVQRRKCRRVTATFLGWGRFVICATAPCP